MLSIQEPTLIIDKKKCKENIAKMNQKTLQNQIEFRPHFKTHVSLEIGEWFKKIGVNKITVSSLKMAQYFSNHWNNITVAFPINILKIDLINELASTIQLNIVVENKKAIQFLKNNLKYKVHVFIKIDAGYGRTGIHYSKTKKIAAFIQEINDAKKMKFEGFLSHAGNSYSAKGKKEIIQIHKRYSKKLIQLKKYFISKYPNIKISIGDTPTCSVAEDFSWADEMRPGNFIFYDIMQWAIGSNSLKNIAIAMACPIVAKHKKRNEIIIHGGGIHFSKDDIHHPKTEQKIYGLLVQFNKKGWAILPQKNYLKKLSQEHGTLSVSKKIMKQYQVGDVIGILPIHSCMTANLMKEYITLKGRKISRL